MSPEHRPHQEEPAPYQPPQVEDVASADVPIVTAAMVSQPGDADDNVE